MQQMQMANMQAIQDQWFSQCQNSIMSQVQYNYAIYPPISF